MLTSKTLSNQRRRLAGYRWLLLTVVVWLAAIPGWLDGLPATTLPPERLRWGYDPTLPTGENDRAFAMRPLPSSYTVDEVVAGLRSPTQLAAAPDGRLFVAERRGVVRTVEDGVLLPEPFVTIPAFLPKPDDAELGLTGLAVDPAFEQNGYVYLYYAADSPRRTVVARVREQSGIVGDVEKLLSVEWDPCCRVGGGMRFAPDGTLLVAVGDHESPLEAQSPVTPFGTILRINGDGSWPRDNPFVGPVYAYGVRNVYDIAIDPATGRIFAGENGDAGQDALLEIKAGANYGWPGLSRAEQTEIEQPLIFYHGSYGMTGMEFYSGDLLDELDGHLLFCQFQTGMMHDVEFSADGQVVSDSVILENCHTDVITGPGGIIYFLDYVDGAVYRIAVD